MIIRDNAVRYDIFSDLHLRFICTDLVRTPVNGAIPWTRPMIQYPMPISVITS
jgi:hypothetical protein